MKLRERFLAIFNRDTEYLIEYREDEKPAAAFSAEEIPEEDRVVIAVTLAALAAGGAQNADYRITSMRRVK